MQLIESPMMRTIAERERAARRQRWLVQYAVVATVGMALGWLAAIVIAFAR